MLDRQLKCVLIVNDEPNVVSVLSISQGRVGDVYDKDYFINISQPVATGLLPVEFGGKSNSLDKLVVNELDLLLDG